jgi:prepilin-type N-terminal cleavage/methylation domain-containing protein
VPTRDSSDGFSLVEVVVALFLFGLISLAILPAMITGLQISAEQSSVAVATRHLNALVESVRSDPTCASLSAAVALQEFLDGRGDELESTGSAPGGGTPPCTPGALSYIHFRATDARGAELFSLDTVVLIEAES